uniref:Uncharacterized protein n=1 Tax=Anguilla anguilla TaxID=7936 RepID=A0A0E9U2F2_ANGAN
MDTCFAFSQKPGGLRPS